MNRPDYRRPGGSTAMVEMVRHRLDKVKLHASMSGRWLDCGCSDGGYTQFLTSRGATAAVGLEPQLDLLKNAQANRSPEVAYVCAVSEALPFADQTFDGALLNEVLEHVENERHTLGELYRVITPGGYLAVMSPNRWFPFEGHGMRVGGYGVPMPIPLLPWLPKCVGSKVMEARNYWPGELQELLRSAGFELCHLGSVFPTFEVNAPWLPTVLIGWYRQRLADLEKLPGLGKFGVSTFVVGRKPG